MSRSILVWGRDNIRETNTLGEGDGGSWVEGVVVEGKEKFGWWW